MQPSPIRLLLVDDDGIVRVGLRAVCGTVPHFAIVGEADSRAQAVALARTCRPDVVLMDVRLPDGTGVEACREIRSQWPRTRVLMLTAYSDDDTVVASILAGAAGYVVKHTPPERLVQAIELVANGGALLDPAVTGVVLQRLRQGGMPEANDPLCGLSEREHEILSFIADGKTNREIAATTGISEYTVRNHVTKILQKLDRTRRTEAAAFFVRRTSLATGQN
jgi:DNA-binding NarL/FixJ family response regulator